MPKLPGLILSAYLYVDLYVDLYTRVGEFCLTDRYLYAVLISDRVLN
ncbi:hypothetical protein Pse7367_1802 [Thalassoporum mexicanum PCC 7367]|nr:hypothetical protein [Pseudanabaena sp. PCC 7367]AFY70079.1 hypothetical protein Pse7367_1802 [Pseudanabaena sp. PCC 7367]